MRTGWARYHVFVLHEKLQEVIILRQTKELPRTLLVHEALVVLLYFKYFDLEPCISLQWLVYETYCCHNFTLVVVV